VPPTSVDKDNSSKDLNKCCSGSSRDGQADRTGASSRL